MRKFTLRPLIATLRSPRWSLALAGAVAPGLVLGAPSGGQVVAGQAAIGGTGGNTVINQSTNSAVINWQQFSVGNSEYVLFNQPSASATVLNRVVGGNPSEILGNITANGRVFLINPNGVMFGQGSKVDVGSLVASSLNISDSDFMQGRYAFAGTPGSSAAVSNAGQITAADGGFVVLAGGKVSNSGLVQAQLGTVALASGSAVTLGLDGQGLVDFSVDGAALSAAAGVENIGSLIADGGSVIMSAHTARGLIGNAVNNSGTVQARSIGEHEGSIYLLAEGGNISQGGVVDASGASQANGGKVRIAGDGDIVLTGDSTTLAHGRGGGEIGVIAEQTMRYEQGAKMDVGARQKGARGGVAEFSGHGDLKIRDTVALGYGGKLVLDPAEFTIGSNGTISEIDLETMLKTNFSGSTVQIVASEGIRLLNLSDGVLDGTTASQDYGAGLQLRIGSCYGGANICNSSFTPGASGFIRFDDVNDRIQVDGDIHIESGTETGDIAIGSLTSRKGSIDIYSAGTISTRNLTAQDGGIEVYTGGGEVGGITTGALTATNGSIDVSATVGDISTGNIEVNGGFAAVSIQAEDGGISTGNIRATSRSSVLFQVEGSGSVISSAELTASRGISTGDITITALGDATGATGTALSGALILGANNSFDEGGYGGPAGGGGDLSTGNIVMDVRPEGTLTAVQSSAIVYILNGNTGVDQNQNPLIFGGNVSTGNISINARGVGPQPFCQGSECGSLSAATLLLGAYTGDVTSGNISIASSSTLNDSTGGALVAALGGGDITLGNVTLSANLAPLTVVASLDPNFIPGGNPPAGGLDQRALTVEEGGSISIGRIQGVKNLDLFADGNITVNAGNNAILPSGEDVDVNIEAGGTVTLKGLSLQLSGDIDARRLVIETTQDTIAEGDANIDVGGMSIKARRIDLREAESLSIGSETMNLGSDPALLASVPADLRPSSTGPNLALMASESVQLDHVSLGGDYIFVRAPQIASFSVSCECDLFYNYRPFGDTASLTVPTGSLLGASDVTFALGGTGYRGDITISPLNQSTSLAKAESNVNFLFLTQGRVNGKAVLSGATSGQVLVLAGSAEEPQEPGEIPQEEMEVISDTASSVSQMDGTESFSGDGFIGMEVADASLVEETSESPDESLECR